MERAAGRGELAPSKAASLAAEAGPAILLLRWLIRGLEIDADGAVLLVDDVMMPLRRSTSGS